MSSTYTEPFDRLTECLDQIAAIDPTYRTTTEKQDGLVGLARFIARAQAEQLRILAAADDIAETTGDRSVAAWLATQTRDNHGAVRRHATLAQALDTRWTQVAAAFAAGQVNLAQTRVITDALTALPQGLGDDLLAKAETLLLTEAATLGPRELQVYGSRVLEYLAPGVAEEVEYQRLLAAEDRACSATRLTMRGRGDGSTEGHFRVPDALAGRLRAYLHAFLAPRRHHRWHDAGQRETPFGPLSPAAPDEFADLPLPRQQGIAFTALLEHIPATALPQHGGTATTVVVAVELAALLANLHAAGIVETSTGQVITAGEARRLACNAGILPLVLGGRSEILDAGREQRVVKGGMRKVLNVRDKTCTAEGCTIPAAFCEAHHTVAWSRGGSTSVKDCKLLCPFHHRRAHHPEWKTHHHPNGKTSFTRRQ